MKEDLIEKAFIVFLVVLGIFYLYLASHTQMLGEDEAFYYELGEQFSTSSYPVRYQVSNPQVLSPFISLSYALPFMLFGPSLELGKIITAVFGILTLLMVYLIGKKTNIYYGIISAFILLSITLFTHFMFITYQEIPIAFFSALATLLFLNMNSFKRAILLGAVLSLTFYVKQSGLILLGSFFLYAIFLYFYEKDRKYLKLSIFSIIVSVFFILPFIIRNLYLYNYPHTQFLNFFFKAPQAVIWEGVTSKMISPLMSDVQSYTSNFGWLVVISLIFGLSLFLNKVVSERKIAKHIFLFVLISFIFLTSYYTFYFLNIAIVESRYFAIIFPQISLLGGYFLWKLKEKNKYFLVLMLLTIIFSVYSSISVASSTAASQRYPSNYIEALNWIKEKTNKNDLIMTTYSGSVKYFAERDTIWSINELLQIMTTSNTTYIYEMMKKYNISYILVWRDVLGQDFIIPESNLNGIFTFKFLNNVINDSKQFNITYQNQDNIIFKVLYE